MPLDNLLENEFEVIYQTKQPISDIENMDYWKFEKFVEFINKRNEEQRKEQKKQEQQQQKQQQGSSIGKYNMNSMMKKFKSPKF